MNTTELFGCEEAGVRSPEDLQQKVATLHNWHKIHRNYITTQRMFFIIPFEGDHSRQNYVFHHTFWAGSLPSGLAVKSKFLFDTLCKRIGVRCRVTAKVYKRKPLPALKIWLLVWVSYYQIFICAFWGLLLQTDLAFDTFHRKLMKSYSSKKRNKTLNP